MALFQQSVLQHHLKGQDKEVIAKAYKKYIKYFHSPAIQQNIKESKEEQFQAKFLDELFVNIFGYTLSPQANYNLATEYKNESNSRKCDGAILKGGNALAVIELKGTKTKDLESIRQQAFDYKANQTGCVYVITSNFEKLRFYVNNAVDFEEFNLFNLSLERFELMYLCLHSYNLLTNVPLSVKESSIREEEGITKKFYGAYSLFKRELYRDLVKQNMKNEVFRSELTKEDEDRATKNIKMTLFKKSQKLIDRFLFIFFGEDRNLLPPNSTVQILEDWDKLKELDAVVPLYDRFKLYFNYLDTGRKGTATKKEIFAYNGGLFKPDGVLDSIVIDDELLYRHTKALSNYNFDSQIDVNILGHIFENSLNEIESVNAEIEGTEFDKQTTKRKKDGVFYTPKYITKYIVDNTVGKLCTEKKQELGVVEAEYLKSRKGRTKDKLKELQGLLVTYREWLLTLTIVDPACGSGAFLNQALDFLIAEHRYLDELEASLLGGSIVFQDIENTILEKNIFGVDLNDESVEIAKLSLWLRTAQPRRKLNDLSSNIKCGNSLIDKKSVAGDKAFNWEEQFPEVFKKKEKSAYHITTATHDSRTSQRMIDYKVRERRDNGARPKAEGIWLEPEDEVFITEIVANIVKKDDLNVLAYNICGDHMHLLLVCEEKEVSKIVGKIKGKTSREFNHNKGINPLVQKGEDKSVSLWTQKFGSKEILDEKQLWNTIEYIETNREKHELPQNKKLKPLIKKICCSYDQAFRTETSGGFDVVIGNPPYVRAEIFKDIKGYLETSYSSYHGNADLYVYFYELGVRILKKDSLLSFIAPNKWIESQYGQPLRKHIVSNYSITKFLDFGEAKIFDGVGTFPSIVILHKQLNSTHLSFSRLNNLNFIKSGDLNLLPSLTIKQSDLTEDKWVLQDSSVPTLLRKLEAKFSNLGSLVSEPLLAGIKTGANKLLIFTEQEVDTIVNSDEPSRKLFRKICFGKEVIKYGVNLLNNYVFFPYELINGKQVPISLSNYPVLESFFADRKEELIKRAIIKDGVPKGTHKWYELQQVNKVFDYNKPKIIYPDISLQNRFVYDESGLIPDMTCFFIPVSSPSLIPIFNSRLFKFLAGNYCPVLGDISSGGRIRYKSNYLSKIPLPDYSNKELNLGNYYNSRASLSTNFIQKEQSFITYLNHTFKLDSISQKLQNWHDLEFGDFIKELNKAIKKANKENINKGLKSLAFDKLTKLQEMEWMEVFETKKAEAQALKAEIDKTDREIDQLVYELYGLTDEEIAIVEGSSR